MHADNNDWILQKTAENDVKLVVQKWQQMQSVRRTMLRKTVI